MKKSVWTGALCVMLCLLLMLPSALAETREGVIMLEGMEEPITETLHESPLGFSVWYPADRMTVYTDYWYTTDAVMVEALYSDDEMVIFPVDEEGAQEYVEDFGMDIVEMSAETRAQVDIYREPEEGQIHFLTLVAEKGRYVAAVGVYSMEAAEGNAKFFDRILESIAFMDGAPVKDPTENQDDDDFESYERSILIADHYYTLGDSTVADFEKNGWTWTQEADGRFAFQVTEEGNYFYVKTDNNQPDGKLVMVDMFYAYDIAYEYLGFGFDLAYNPDMETDIYYYLEEIYDGEYTDEGILQARTEVRGGTLLIELGELALRLTLE